jgi:hypothetical protein
MNLLSNLLELMGLLTLGLVALIQRKVESSEYMTQLQSIPCIVRRMQAASSSFSLSIELESSHPVQMLL